MRHQKGWLGVVRRSNLAKLSRLEKRGYVFSEEYKRKVGEAKGKMKTSGMRANAEIIFNEKQNDLYIRNSDYSDVQIEKLKIEFYKYKNAITVGDIEKASNIKKFILSGNVSDKRPKRLNEEQIKQHKARLESSKISDTAPIPEYGTQEYWEWRDFERNREIFVYYGAEHGLPPDLLEAAANDKGVMYRFNNSEGFIQRYIYGILSEEDKVFFMENILTRQFIEDFYESYKHDDDIYEVDYYETIFQQLE